MTNFVAYSVIIKFTRYKYYEKNISIISLCMPHVDSML